MPTNYEDVMAFHDKYELTQLHDATDTEWLEYRVNFMQEELNEFVTAWRSGDKAGMFDALLDMSYVILGTAIGLGFPWQKGWARVQAANMAKVRTKRAFDSKRGSTYDVVKPPGWTAPELEDLV